MAERRETGPRSTTGYSIMWNDENNNNLTRRDFLRVGALGVGGLSLAELAAVRAADSSKAVNCILLFLVGGPSQLDTWDLKPDAPDNIRGPFRPIKTNAPGVEICEHFPLMAQMADRYAILRSVHHTAAPIHETGQQMMQTGCLFKGEMEYPHYGSVLSHLRGQTSDESPPFVVLPAPIRHTGVSVSHGQTAGYLGARHEPFVLGGEQLNAMTRTEKVRSRYGNNAFGQSCLGARQLVEQGVRFVTVNMFDTVFDKVTWDCHADGGSLSARLDDYKETLCPMFDRGYTALLEDLKQRGMLDTTLVLAMGEFGRTPRLNPRGGRDHWTGCWSMLFAGAGVRGGQVVGASDKIGAEPKSRPVTPAEVAATIYRGLGVDLDARLPGPDNRLMPIIEAAPIEELFRG
jgi:uncharacterized protein (DUF1501 family)